MSDNKTKTYWLDNVDNRNRLFYIVMILAVLAAIPDILSLFNFLYETHPYTEVEKIPVFYGLYAAIVFLVLIVIAKVAQTYLTQKEDYYD